MAQRIVIIGGGPAGYEAALVGAKYGAEVTVVEDAGMGGSSVLWDCVPSKAFIAATGVRTDMRRADEMGLRPDFSQRKIDFTAVNERVKRLAQQQSDDVRAQMEREGIKMLQGRGRLDDHDPGRVTHYVTPSTCSRAARSLLKPTWCWSAPVRPHVFCRVRFLMVTVF